MCEFTLISQIFEKSSEPLVGLMSTLILTRGQSSFAYYVKRQAGVFSICRVVGKRSSLDCLLKPQTGALSSFLPRDLLLGKRAIFLLFSVHTVYLNSVEWNPSLVRYFFQQWNMNQLFSQLCSSVANISIPLCALQPSATTLRSAGTAMNGMYRPNNGLNGHLNLLAKAQFLAANAF